MAKVSLIITQDNGDVTIVEQELAEGELSTFNEIEKFTLYDYLFYLITI